MVRLGLILALLAVVAVGCDSGSESADQPSATTQAATTAPEQSAGETQQATTEAPPRQSAPRSTRRVTLYTKADLPRVALQPADAPDDMHYTREESGPKTLFDVGLILDDQVAEVRSYGFRGVYDVIFDSTTSDVRLASRLWLFREAEGARRWLEKTRGDSSLFEFRQVPAPRLGDGSWAARGSANGSDVISHAFRAGNLVVVVSYSTQSVTLSEADVLATAKKAVARVLRR